MDNSINAGVATSLRLRGVGADLGAFAWPLVRVSTGLFYVPHGLQKLFGFWEGGLPKYAPGFAKLGFEPGMFWAGYIGSLELFGGLMLAFGLLTRLVAAQFCVFMALGAFYVTIRRGYFWTGGGMELSLYLLLICLAILAHGGGAWSLDRAFRRSSRAN